MCFVFIWEQTGTCATYSINWLVFITETGCVYCAVRTGSLNVLYNIPSLKGSKPNCLLWPHLELHCVIWFEEHSRKQHEHIALCNKYAVSVAWTTMKMDVGSSVPVWAHHFLLALPLPCFNPTRHKYPTQSIHWHTSFTCLWRWNR